LESKIVLFIILSTIIATASGYGISYLTFNSQIQTLQTRMNGMTAEFSSLSSTVQSMGNAIAYQNLDIEEVKTKLSQINASLQSILNNPSVYNMTYLNSLLSSLEDDLSEINSTLTNAISALNSTINKIESRAWHKIYTLIGTTTEYVVNKTYKHISG